jgi:SAM-dependent methyltransferase
MSADESGVTEQADAIPGGPDRKGVGPFLAKAGPDALVGDPTVAEGWERYARGHRAGAGTHLGDEWNSAEKLGVTVPAGGIPLFLDRQVFGPFLGEPEVILEIGAGGGRFTDVLLPRCRRLIAADTSPTMLEHLRRRFGDDGRLEIQLLDGRGLGATPDASVDAVFSYGVFVHLQHWDIFNYVRETARVLAGRQGRHPAQYVLRARMAALSRQVGLRSTGTSIPGAQPHDADIMREFAVRPGSSSIDSDFDRAPRLHRALRKLGAPEQVPRRNHGVTTGVRAADFLRHPSRHRRVVFRHRPHPSGPVRQRLGPALPHG